MVSLNLINNSVVLTQILPISTKVVYQNNMKFGEHYDN